MARWNWRRWPGWPMPSSIWCRPAARLRPTSWWVRGHHGYSSRLVVNQASAEDEARTAATVIDALPRRWRSEPYGRDQTTRYGRRRISRRNWMRCSLSKRARRGHRTYGRSTFWPTSRRAAMRRCSNTPTSFDHLTATAMADLELSSVPNCRRRSPACQPSSVRRWRRRTIACASITSGRNWNPGPTPRPTAPCSARRSRRSIASVSTCRAARRPIRRRC